MQDWTGNSNSIFKIIGASNHTDADRQTEDYYATDPKAVEFLLQNEHFHLRIWECACGQGHISKVLEKHGHNVISTDLTYRGYGLDKSLDFLHTDVRDFDGDIITNPPYKYAKEFVEKAIDVIKCRRKVAMLLKLTFLEGKARQQMFRKYPPKTIYVFSSRIKCAKNGVFSDAAPNAVAYAWFVWEKGFSGNPQIKWIN